MKKSITEKVQSLNDAYLETNMPRVDFSNVPEECRTAVEGFYEAIVQTKALNEGWVPDWNNSNQRKHIPWFHLSSGFAFDGPDYDCSDARAGCASRLCFVDEERASHAGQTPALMEAYKKMMIK